MKPEQVCRKQSSEQHARGAEALERTFAWAIHPCNRLGASGHQMLASCRLPKFLRTLALQRIARHAVRVIMCLHYKVQQHSGACLLLSNLLDGLVGSQGRPGGVHLGVAVGVGDRGFLGGTP